MATRSIFSLFSLFTLIPWMLITSWGWAEDIAPEGMLSVSPKWLLLLYLVITGLVFISGYVSICLYKHKQHLRKFSEKLLLEISEEQAYEHDDEFLIRHTIELFSLIDGLTGCCLAIRDRNGRFLYRNQSYLGWQSLLPQPVTNYTYNGTYKEDILQFQNESDQEVIATGKSMFMNNLRLHLASGRDLIFNVCKIPIKNKNARVIGIAALLMELATIANTHEEQQKQELRTLEKSRIEHLGLFAGGLAHDINNYLMTILGNAELIAFEASDTAPIQKYVLEIKKAIMQTSDLTLQMLAYSGKGKQRVSSINLNTFLFETVQNMLGNESKISLCYQFSSEQPCIEGDISQIRLAVTSLISNAIEAMADQQNGLITLSTGYLSSCELEDLSNNDPALNRKFIYFSVEDSGPGIDETIRSKIFEPFFTTKFMGRGLGLSAVQGIMRGHQGYIRVENKPQGGASFQLIFPEPID